MRGLMKKQGHIKCKSADRNHATLDPVGHIGFIEPNLRTVEPSGRYLKNGPNYFTVKINSKLSAVPNFAKFRQGVRAPGPNVNKCEEVSLPEPEQLKIIGSTRPTPFMKREGQNGSEPQSPERPFSSKLRHFFPKPISANPKPFSIPINENLSRKVRFLYLPNGTKFSMVSKAPSPGSFLSSIPNTSALLASNRNRSISHDSHNNKLNSQMREETNLIKKRLEYPDPNNLHSPPVERNFKPRSAHHRRFSVRTSDAKTKRRMAVPVHNGPNSQLNSVNHSLQLSPQDSSPKQDIDLIKVKINDLSHQQSKVFVTKYAYYSKVGSSPSNPHKPNQDSFLVNPKILGSSSRHLFGVADGHGEFGHEVSALIKARLPVLLEYYIKKVPIIKMGECLPAIYYLVCEYS